MNAVEIEEAVSELAEQRFDAGEFPYAFLQAHGNKDTSLTSLPAQPKRVSNKWGPALCSSARSDC